MSEYPDHLNPFKDSEKKKLGKTLTRSFRELKGFLRQSFRKKKSKNNKNQENEDVEIRKAYDSKAFNTLRGNVMSLPSPQTYNTYTSPPLPRSRFKERLSMSSLNNTYDERCNPFAEDEGTNPFEDPPVPYRRRRSKLRAPIPPSSSNPDVHYGYKARGSSKWSLTSSETDYTIDDKSECSGDVPYSHSLRECLDNFNKEMDCLNKGSIEMGGSSPNILEGARTKILEETEFTTKSVDVLTATHSKEINNNVTYDLDSQTNDQADTESDDQKADEHSIILPIVDEAEEHQNGVDDQVTKEDIEREEIEKGQEEVIIFTETKVVEDLDKTNFSIDDVKMEYIDQENSSIEYKTSDIDSKEYSPIPKLREINL